MMSCCPAAAVSGTRNTSAWSLLKAGLKPAGTFPVSKMMDFMPASPWPVSTITVPGAPDVTSNGSAWGFPDGDSLSSFLQETNVKHAIARMQT
ncbi:hypothetical protein [Sphingobacterium sp.]|uniref:hypothetical protein n=1 Tax=Sphingobacterium sp. TaxID=341027 RepID=UPI0028974357|nr:hypothetical protein [Sphingobacterium sp.]